MNKYPDTIFRPFANIHDAVDGYVRLDSLHIIPDIMNMMCNWEVEPLLTVDLEASLHNWQDMKEVHDINLWIDSKGEYGYDKIETRA